FDIEWKPQLKRKKDGGIENKTAVLQLATESSCLVFQLYNLGRPPNDLVSVLKDERILKVGSGILQDVTKLKKDTGLKCIGLVDTQKLAKEVGMLESQKLGLKALAKYLLGIELEKPRLLTRSNWENFPLTVKQIHYAALDAWIGLKIYRSMKAMQGKSTCKSLEGSNLLNCEEATMNENSNLVNCEEATMNENSTLVNCEEATMNENPLACHVCGKKFKTSSALPEHLKVHPKCGCGQYFVDKISKNHRKNCTLLNPFSCHVCGRKVKTNSALSKHLKVHGKCPCGQYFVGKIPKKHTRKCSKLKQWGETILKHIKINSDEPGLCNACGKKCATLESLTRHIRKAGHVLCPFCTDLLPCDASHSHILMCQDLTGE
ncbi:PREDICTED: zinc finger protein 37-like, partial [Acropora digitifera]|uniref:zinc finger protein 37-like n=1 Tax=Acropora digitifera TaxID=70779 RepID=UPI00077AA4D9